MTRRQRAMVTGVDAAAAADAVAVAVDVAGSVTRMVRRLPELKMATAMQHARMSQKTSSTILRAQPVSRPLPTRSLLPPNPLVSIVPLARSRAGTRESDRRALQSTTRPNITSRLCWNPRPNRGGGRGNRSLVNLRSSVLSSLQIRRPRQRIRQPISPLVRVGGKGDWAFELTCRTRAGCTQFGKPGQVPGFFCWESRRLNHLRRKFRHSVHVVAPCRQRVLAVKFSP